MVVMVLFVPVMPVMATLIAVPVAIAVTIAEVGSAVIAITIPVFCKREPAEDQSQAKKNYQT
jgi:hypothetical protein